MKCISNPAVRIGDEGKWQFAVFLKFFLSFNRILTHAENLQSLGMQSFIGITKRASLSRASGRLCLGIKIDESDALGIDISKVDRFSILIIGGDLWR